MNRPSISWLLAGAVTAALLLFLNSAVSISSTRQLNDIAARVGRSYQIINNLDNILMLTTEAESSHRGYIITGEDRYLESYISALTSINAKFVELGRLTADNPIQLAQLPDLRRRIDARFNILAEVIDARRIGGFDAAQQTLLTDRGKNEMDAIRAVASEMTSHEENLLGERTIKAERSYWNAIVTEVFAALSITVAIIGLLFLLKKYLKNREISSSIIAEQAERLRTTLSSIGDAVISTDTDGLITNINTAAESLTGWTASDALGRPLHKIFRIVTESTREPVDSPVLRSLREGRVVGLANHTILLAKDGSEVPIDDSAAPIRCKAGEIVGCVLVFRDISSRKREEAASFERNRLVALRADVGTALSSVENTRTVLQNCCEAFVRHLDLAFARIWTLDEGNDVLRLEASAGDYKHLDGPHSRIKVGEFKIGRIAESRQPHLTNNVADDPNIGDPEWAAKENMVAFAGYPLIVEDRLVGVIAMFARRELTASIVEELNPVVHGISQYIDRKHAEGKLDDHAELYRVTLSSIGDGVITTDTDGSVTFMNEVASDLTGWTATAGFGQPLEKVFRIIDETTRETVENPASKVLREGGPKELTKNIVLIAKDGVERPIDESAAPILDDAGNVIGVVLVFHDTGRRRDAARHLQESEVRFGQLADSMPQIVWAAKPDGTLDYYNRRWFQYINLNPSQIEEARWDLYIHPDDLSSAYKRWQESLASGKRYKTEFRVRDAKGEYRWFLAQALPVTDDDGKITRWFGTCTDVDEEKQTADELRNVAARLSEADRRKDEFIAMLAHELRNPLAPIRNALQILRITGGSDNKLRSASEMMERQVGQLVRLVDDLLDVSRISRGKIELRRERIELDSIVYHAVEAARPSCENGGVELNIRMPEEPIFVYGDAARLAQAFGNVLNNACKFTDRDGRIDLSVDPEDEQAVVRILDTGIGISPQQLPRIFDMFVQADTSLERSVSGLGIGLTLVKNLIEMHEGTVEAFSNGLGSGSQFTLRIPRLKEQVMPASTLDAAIHPTLDGPGRRILVVDDNIDSAESLSMLLEISGHTVQMAHDGVEAVEKAANFLPEVVLLDIGLPRLNGYEAARKIRQEIWGKKMVLIALTGWGQEEDRQRSRDAGFDDHMVKPVDHIELMKSLDEIEVR